MTQRRQFRRAAVLAATLVAGLGLSVPAVARPVSYPPSSCDGLLVIGSVFGNPSIIGDPVDAFAYGFTPYEVLTLSIDSAFVQSLPADSTGSAHFTAPIPATVPVGDETAKVVGATSQCVQTATLDVASAPPSVSLAPSAAALTLSKHAIIYGGSLSGTVRVPASDGGDAVVTYGSTKLSVPVAADHDAHFKIPGGALPAGSDTVTARYAGTATVAASPRVTSPVRVARAATIVALAAPSRVHSHRIDVHYAVRGRRYGAQPTGLITLTVSTHGVKRRINLTVPASGRGRTELMKVRSGRTSISLRYGGDPDYNSARTKTVRVRVTG